MKRRVREHRIRCEREQYNKLYRRYENFTWETIDNKIVVKFPEFCRRYKKLVKRLYGLYGYGKDFRSFIKTVRYDTLMWNNHRGREE